jgi:hypothetical protein
MAVAGCDSSLWAHVYHSERLIVKQQCATVTGTIVDATDGKKHDGVRHEAETLRGLGGESSGASRKTATLTLSTSRVSFRFIL